MPCLAWFVFSIAAKLTCSICIPARCTGHRHSSLGTVFASWRTQPLCHYHPNAADPFGVLAHKFPLTAQPHFNLKLHQTSSLFILLYDTSSLPQCFFVSPTTSMAMSSSPVHKLLLTKANKKIAHLKQDIRRLSDELKSKSENLTSFMDLAHQQTLHLAP